MASSSQATALSGSHLPGSEWPIATRSAICLLKAIAADRTARFDGFRPTSEAIASLFGMSANTVNSIYSDAKKRGFNPQARPLQMKNSFFESASRCGRPTMITAENQQAVTQIVSRDRETRQLTSSAIAYRMREMGFQVAATTVLQLLASVGFKKLKPIRKPGLTLAMKAARLDFCLRFAHWTLEMWKDVIWTDETSVTLAQRGTVRVWVQPGERLLNSTIRSRWKGKSVFMFWASFSYDKKGPCHIWKPETAKEKKQAITFMDKLNEAAEPAARAKWEATIAKEEATTGKKSRKTWQFTSERGKLERQGKKGGIDWYRYQKEILHSKLLPFAATCKETRPNTAVIEDGAPAHAHWFTQTVYDAFGIRKLDWPGNSPDLNMIEPIWPWLKRQSQADGITRSKAEAAAEWPELWKTHLPQSKLQAMVERIPGHIGQVILQDGGNLYKESRRHGLTKEEWETKMTEWGKLESQEWQDIFWEDNNGQRLPFSDIAYLITGKNPL